MTTVIKTVDTKIFVGPSAANVRADVTAGPRENWHWRHYRRRRWWWRPPCAEISSMGRCAGHERDTGDAGEQNLLHLDPHFFAGLTCPDTNTRKVPNR